MRLYDIKYKGERIIYELGLQEAIAHYAGNDPHQSGTAYLGEFITTPQVFESSLDLTWSASQIPTMASGRSASTKCPGTISPLKDTACLLRGTPTSYPRWVPLSRLTDKPVNSQSTVAVSRYSAHPDRHDTAASRSLKKNSRT